MGDSLEDDVSMGFVRCLVQLQGTTTTSGGGLIGTRDFKDLGMNFNSQAWSSFRRAVILHHYHCPYHSLDIVNTHYNHITCQKSYLKMGKYYCDYCDMCVPLFLVPGTS